MTKTTSILWMATALTMSAAPAAAQTTKNMFVDINAGVQVASRTFVVDASPDRVRRDGDRQHQP